MLSDPLLIASEGTTVAASTVGGADSEEVHATDHRKHNAVGFSAPFAGTRRDVLASSCAVVYGDDVAIFMRFCACFGNGRCSPRHWRHCRILDLVVGNPSPSPSTRVTRKSAR